ncbi:hypothetical protein [Stutzerimonas stutzeri]|uniref:hypothetical protein n=1 Tax=Stutzerimonas stutzeri TaxID=316 RepID=UPI0015E33B96|nr:hypothetical protein [Stutzerimonas stutzeri]MBA1280335.1 hypothetical protein [Stutzerimonas stutzeri]
MAKLEQVERGGPVLIDPAQYDLDRWATTQSVVGVQPVELNGKDAETFFHWVAECWRPEFELNLQSLSRHETHGDLLTTWLPLVTFREDLCCRGTLRENEAIRKLLDTLRLLTREWRAAGVDTLYISGRDSKYVPR